MSPEAGKPEAQTQTGSNEFIEGIHPTDGVRPFNDAKGDLPDVHEALLERGVPEPAVIDPVTLEVPVDKVPVVGSSTEILTPSEATPITTEKKSGWKKWIAGIIGGAVLTGGGVVAGKAMGGSDTVAEPRVEPSASASPEPGSAVGENEAPQPSNPTETPVENEPTAEVPSGIEPAASIEQYPTAAEAIIPLVERVQEYKNYYGTKENLTSIPLSEEQKAEHEAMLESVFGPNLNSPEVETYVTNLREAWNEIFGYKSLTQQSIDAGYDKPLFEVGAELLEVIPISENQVQFVLDGYTNGEVTGIYDNMSPEYVEEIETDLKVTATLEQSDGGWYIASWQTERI